MNVVECRYNYKLNPTWLQVRVREGLGEVVAYSHGGDDPHIGHLHACRCRSCIFITGLALRCNIQSRAVNESFHNIQ